MGYKGQSEERQPRVFAGNDKYVIWFNRAAFVAYDICSTTKLGTRWSDYAYTYDYVSFIWTPSKNTTLSLDAWYVHVGKTLNDLGFSWEADIGNADGSLIAFNLISRQVKK